MSFIASRYVYISLLAFLAILLIAFAYYAATSPGDKPHGRFDTFDTTLRNYTDSGWSVVTPFRYEGNVRISSDGAIGLSSGLSRQSVRVKTAGQEIILLPKQNISQTAVILDLDNGQQRIVILERRD